MKFNLKAIVATMAISAISIFTVGCSPVDNVKGWVDQIFCKHENTEIVEAVAPTCAEDGYTEYEKCVDCGKEVIKGAVIETTGHTIEITKGYAATCTTMGLMDKKTCTVCEEVIEEAKRIPVLGHKKKEVKAVAATCTEAGHTAGVICEHGCGTIFSGYETIPAKGHTYTNGLCEDCGAGISAADLEKGVDYTGYMVRPKYDYDYVETLLKESSVPSGVVTLYFSENEDLGILVYFNSQPGVFDDGCSIDLEIESYINLEIFVIPEDDYVAEYVEWKKGEENVSFTLGEFFDENGVDVNGAATNTWVYSGFDVWFNGYDDGENDFIIPPEWSKFILDLIEFVPPAAASSVSSDYNPI